MVHKAVLKDSLLLSKNQSVFKIFKTANVSQRYTTGQHILKHKKAKYITVFHISFFGMYGYIVIVCLRHYSRTCVSHLSSVS